ncbi:MAG: hypothetical protein AUJ85_02485 [Elusimicrobia bacterium CG1_02_37_114]|nr:MAG: hypothetical protein AUJ85_02485 [Elusimicrobia bacterium CG1_02_37_114]PIV52625.1 MAG: hypothetical protein COS17_08170 [Elusimicrobia bacterium CG02_land_8_20_14_3_00_37_13]PIZ13540.1 MAG: hypothetical protein COY53_04275 [Elusimicrobia bacterium CG_4_10_14_0_8_um_filter_37_32]
MLLDKLVPESFRRTYTIDSISGIFVAFYMGLTAPFVAIVARRLGASALLISMIVSAPFIGQLFCNLWIKFMRGKEKIHFVVWGSAASRVLMLLMAVVTGPAVYTSIIVAQNLINPGAGLAYADVMKRVYPDEYRGRAMGYIRIEVYLVLFILSIMAGKLMDLYGYKVIFPIATVFGLLSSFTFSAIKVAKIEQNEINSCARKFHLSSDKKFLTFLSFYSIWGFANLLSASLYPIFMVDKLNVSNFQIGILYALINLIALLGYFYWGGYIDKKSIFSGNIKCMLCISSVSVVYFLVSVLNLNFWFLLPVSLFQGFGMAGGELVVFNLILKFAPQDKIPEYMAQHMFAMAIRGILAPQIGSQLSAIIGMPGVFMISFCLGMIAIILLSRYYKQLDTIQNIPVIS